MTATATTGAPGARLASLDIFRGITIASMILVNNPGNEPATYPQLLHADWHGWTFTDLIFPSFIWIVGVAMTLSYGKRIERGDSRGRLLLHTIRRAALIFLVGLVLNGFPYYRLATLRIPGVLQRIAICYLVAGILYLFLGLRAQIAVGVCLCALYWVLMTAVPVPGYGPGVLEKQGNIAQYVDSLFLTGHMWSHTKTWDPEGLISTLPAIGTALLGVFCGRLLRIPMTAAERSSWMFAGGNALIVAGLALSPLMPINKNLWTVPFMLLTGGFSTSFFALCYWLADGRGWQRWGRPFAIYGMNAIAVYVLSGVLARLLGLIRWPGPDGKPLSLEVRIYEGVFAPLACPANASLLYALANVLVLYGVAWLMYRRKWFIRL